MRPLQGGPQEAFRGGFSSEVEIGRVDQRRAVRAQLAGKDVSKSAGTRLVGVFGGEVD